MASPKIKIEDIDVRPYVRERYSAAAGVNQPTSSADCGCAPAGSACCGAEDAAQLDLVSRLYQDSHISELPQDVTGLSLGCGDPVTLASLKEGQTVLDLGSGAGIDCFLAAKKVGPTGKVIGVDMTPAMLDRARLNKAKLEAQNVEFRLGEIEHLPVADATVDVVISNCVINLSQDKPQVFREAFRVLRPGGRMAVSDIVTDGPLPAAIKDNISNWAGCIAGAWEAADYVAAIQAAGFVDVELIPVYWDDELIQDAVNSLDPQVKQQIEDAQKSGMAVIVLSEGTDAELVELDPSVDLTQSDLSKAVFSAKVTARKPLE